MAYILEFLDLVDTPATFASQAGKIVAVNPGETALEFASGVNADALDGIPLSAATPSDGDALVYDGVIDNRWENVVPPWLRRDGGTMTGYITLHADPSNNLHAASKQYVDINFAPVGHDHDGDYIQALGGTPVAGNLLEISDADTLLDTGLSSAVLADALAVFPLVGWPSGVDDDFLANTALDFDEGTRTFTLTVSDDVTYWIKGRMYALASGADPSIQIPDTEGEYFIYLDENGDLNYTTTWTSALLLEGSAYITDVYWDATNNEYLFMLDERHKFMPPSVHVYIHRRFSAYIESGFGLGGITVNGNGGSDSHATLSVASGEIIDEDRSHSFAGATSPAQIPVFYLSGATPVLRRFSATNAPVVKGTNRAYYNQFTAGAWTLTEVAQGDFVFSWLVATNDPEQPIVAIMGQTDYSTKNNARDGAPGEISSIILLLPFEEVTFIGGVLYQSSTVYTNTWAARIVDVDGADYFDVRQSNLGSGSPPTSHAALSDRDLPGQHPDYAIDVSEAYSALLKDATTLDLALDIVDALSEQDIPLTGTYTGELASATTLGQAMLILDDLNDSRVDLRTAHTGILSGQSTVDDAMNILDGLVDDDILLEEGISDSYTGPLAGAVTVKDAMDVLDALAGSDIDIDDEDVDVTGAYGSGGLLNGDTTLDQALDTINAITTEFTTRQQVMGGSKASVSDNTVTTIMTFTMPTGPSSLAAALTFVGACSTATNSAKVIIQGWLMCVRNSSGTVTAEWVETFNDNKSSGIGVTFGTCEVTATISTADVLVKIQLDSNLDQSWGVKWTALISDDVTVTQA